MDESESRGPGSHSRGQTGPDDIAVSPSDRTNPDANVQASGCVGNPGNDLKVLAEQRVSRRPKVSVMVITYNHEKYIAQALESVLMQETDFDFEINVIEDCSMTARKKLSCGTSENIQISSSRTSTKKISASRSPKRTSTGGSVPSPVTIWPSLKVTTIGRHRISCRSRLIFSRLILTSRYALTIP